MVTCMLLEYNGHSLELEIQRLLCGEVSEICGSLFVGRSGLYMKVTKVHSGAGAHSIRRISHAIPGR